MGATQSRYSCECGTSRLVYLLPLAIVIWSIFKLRNGPGSARESRTLPYNSVCATNHIPIIEFYAGLYVDIKTLIRDNKYADLLIICGSDRYPVHRAILCPRSGFFDEHCTPREGERDYASPAKPTKIWIDPSDCQSHVLSAVLTFLYMLDYSADGHQALTFGLPEEVVDEGSPQDLLSPGPSYRYLDDKASNQEESAPHFDDNVESVAASWQEDRTPLHTPSELSSQATADPSDPSERVNELAFHVQVCAAAQRFGIPPLCDTARAKLATRLASSAWNSEMVDCIREVYREVYRNGNGGHLGKMRETVVDSAMSRFRTLKECEGWDDLVIEVPEFAAEMLGRM